MAVKPITGVCLFASNGFESSRRELRERMELHANFFSQQMLRRRLLMDLGIGLGTKTN